MELMASLERTWAIIRKEFIHAGRDPRIFSHEESYCPVLELPSGAASNRSRPVKRGTPGRPQAAASSNSALLCLATLRSRDGSPDLVATCIYKPVMGERPLADFPIVTR